ncbi:MAG: flagellar hook-associated protein FlgK [Methylophaga sp.]|nr:MAG: flagellar hook-associated protein FlgK [Methylophaga sp.]
MSLLNIGVSALLTSQASLATASHNISNVNTEGYIRQRADHITRQADFQGSHYVGTGVTIGGVERIYDNFLASQVRTYTSQQSQQETFSTFSKQIDDLLGSPQLGLNNGLESFFNAVHEVANDPTSLSARQVMLTEGSILANRFNTIDRQLGELNKQADNLLAVSVKDINTLSQGIAELNNAIIAAGASRAGDQPNDLLDKRDQLINELSKYLTVNTIPEDTGAVTVIVGNGQALVVGTSNIKLHEIVDTSTNPVRVAIGYGPTQIDVSLQLTGGSVGGAFQVRNDVIGVVQAELDALALGVTANFNSQHQKGVTLGGNIGGDFFAIPTPPATADAGSIRMAISDPRDIAIAFPVGVTNTSTTGSGQIEIANIDAVPPLTLPLLAANITLTFNAATNEYTADDGVNPAVTIAYNPNTDGGKSVSLLAPMVELTLVLNGVPANGDVITLGNSASVGDNRNALALADLQVAKTLNGSTQSFADFYGVTVANVATRTHQADIGQKAQQGLLDQVSLRFDSISGVNLDEEAANLIRFQQSYQAASQIITVSNTIFDALLSAVR